MVNSQVRVLAIRVCAGALVGSLLLQSACGTLLYPERRGQAKGQIDTTVAILNGLGLLLFIIPGLIAFAIDFSTGAIYLPPGEDGSASKIQLEPHEMTAARIAAVLTEHTGTLVTEDDVRAMQLEGNPEAIEKHLAELKPTS